MLIDYNECTWQQRLNTFPSFKSVGRNTLISDKAVFYGAENIEIGENCRIDDFVILSAGKKGFKIGNYVHIACYALIIGKGRVVMDDFSAISSRVAVYSSSDPYDGTWMTNPCIPEEFRRTYHKDVYIGKHVVVGAGSTVLPGASLPIGCAVGSMSLIRDTIYDPNTILAGIPARFIKHRLYDIYELEKKLTSH